MASAVIGAAIMLAGCNADNKLDIAAVQPRGATVAFESIDGPPRAQFRTLVQDLNNDARARRMAVASREQPSAYRVRGYLAATVDQGKTTISWVWDVFNRDRRRALRISGSEIAKAGQGTGWQVANGAMMRHIANSSMTQLAAFLTSPAAAPGTTSGPQVAFAAPDDSTPEAAGIFRIVDADPDTAPAPTGGTAASPLPPLRPAPGTAVSRGKTMTLAAASTRR